ncbi:MAG: OmpA family protein [Bacteroidota bacterium]|nr:OmpA family protein [Bacteroidota bacterium]
MNFQQPLSRKFLFRVGVLQCFALILVFTVMQCTQKEKPAASDLPSVNTGVPIVNLPEPVKDGINKLKDIKMEEGTIGDQLMNFARSAEYDLGEIFKFINLRFMEGSGAIVDKTDKEIVDLAAFMNAFPRMTIKMESYTDNEGDDKKNEKLSQNRVDAIKNKLVTLGVSEERIVAKGLGEKYPVADNKTFEGRLINNRIEVSFTKFL